MINRFVLFFFISIFAISIFAQEEKPEIAVLINYETIDDTNSKKVFDTFAKNLNATRQSKFQFYHWDEKNGKLEFRPSTENSQPRPCDKIVFLSMYIKVMNDSELNLEVDKTGKTTFAFFSPYVNYAFVYKLVDFGTSKIELINKIRPSGEDSDLKRIYVNFAEVFKTDPSKLQKSNAKEYNKQVAALRKKYDLQIQKEIDIAISKVASKTNIIVTGLKSIRDTRLFKISDFDKTTLDGKKKLKEFVIDAGLADDLQQGEMLDVVCKTQYGDFTTFEKIDFTHVEEANQNSSTCGSSLFSGKKLTNALRDNYEVYVSRSPLLLRELNKIEETTKTVSLYKNCILCGLSFEQMLLKMANIELIERIPLNLLTYFSDLSKSDVNLNYNIEKIQGNQQGARYLLHFESNKITATDVETGRVITETTNNTGGWLELPENQKTLATRLFLDLFEKEVEIIEVSSEKKNKVKYILAYHPFGFVRDQYFKIYEKTSETINGKSLERKIQLGVAIVRDLKSDQIAELYIIDGKEGIYEALESNTKIILANE